MLPSWFIFECKSLASSTHHLKPWTHLSHIKQVNTMLLDPKKLPSDMSWPTRKTRSMQLLLLHTLCRQAINDRVARIYKQLMMHCPKSNINCISQNKNTYIFAKHLLLRTYKIVALCERTPKRRQISWHDWTLGTCINLHGIFAVFAMLVQIPIESNA